MESLFRILTIFIMSNELKLDDCEYLCNAQVILYKSKQDGDEAQRDIEQEQAQGEHAQVEKAQGAKAQGEKA
ncbi:hypothetical protein KXX14_001967 [Aspergillus fumigatus]|nr:hypothetical protein KXX14_001967 [Aspergillus fumigatus]